MCATAAYSRRRREVQMRFKQDIIFRSVFPLFYCFSQIQCSLYSEDDFLSFPTIFFSKYTTREKKVFIFHQHRHFCAPLVHSSSFFNNKKKSIYENQKCAIISHILTFFSCIALQIFFLLLYLLRRIQNI